MKLKIADDLSLPLDAATQTFAFIARKGAGKTYAAGKLVELLLEAHVQVVVLDTVGNWYGLRLAADGKTAGFDVPVLGGLRGDIPLEAAGGTLIADIVVETGRSLVIDMSQFSLADRKRFAAAFGERLWQRKKGERHPSPLHLVIEESQLIIPQNVQGDTARMVGIFEEIIRLGRNYGIGVSMITQRPQSVNKEVLNQTECLLVGQVNGAQERDALKKWITHQGMDVHLVDELPGLKIGTFYVWSPQWLNLLQRVQIRPKVTYDASATPKVGDKRVQRDLKPLDLSELQERLKATIEKAKAEDPRELRRQIAALKADLAARNKTLDQVDVQTKRIEQKLEKVKTVERFVLKDGQLARLEKLYERILTEAERHASAIALFWKQQSEEAKALLNVLAMVTGERQPFRPADVVPIRRQRDNPTTTRVTQVHSSQGRRVPPPTGTRRPAPLVSSNGDGGGLGKCERAILGVLAQTRGGCTASKLTVLTRYRYSGGFKNALTTLRTAGYMVGENTGTMQITGAGVDALGPYDPLPTGAALADYWLQHASFGKCERAVLQALLEHPKGLTADRLCELTDYQYSGGFKNALTTLRTAGVLVGKNTETMTASADLFD
jgi:hypothetical protein